LGFSRAKFLLKFSANPLAISAWVAVARFQNAVLGEGTNTKITNLLELNRCGEMVGSVNGSGSDVYINITINGVAARIAAKYVA